MNKKSFLTSTCRCCCYYQHEGRRGGSCSQLGVPVKGCWSACSLASHPFTNAAAPNLEIEIGQLEHALTLDCTVSDPVSMPITQKVPEESSVSLSS